MYSLVFLLSALSLLALAHCYNFYQCQPCRGEECDVEPEGCKHGKFRDPCGRWKCTSGPGQRCGGRDNHLGKCGKGMTCNCNRCKGCSSDLYITSRILECDVGDAPYCY